ncbi:hypothetical protein L3X38_034944 [Prunus dulcis]|uniref:Uncharacterized protein n=1 Tax=Prunus dulcis TaxID=3755 RepID=A0AAD4YYD1_PRUDU|nr:hypothetical protein L3X38_034944 [Prunus dulcis]
MEVSVELRARERSFGKVVNVNDRDEELALFLEMRRREKDKEKNTNFLLRPNKNADELDAIAAPLDSDNRGGSEVSRIVGPVAPQRKSRMDEFLNSENEKSDYDWLLTPPATPLFPSLDSEALKTAISQTEVPIDRVSGPKSRLANIKPEPTSRGNIASKHPTLTSGLNSSSIGNRRPSSSGGPAAAPRRSATPTGRSSLPSSTKPSRSSTPNSRATLSSVKPMASTVRSSTPSRSIARSSTPTARPSVPASKSTSRSATPTHRPSSSIATTLSAPSGRSSSATKPRPTSSKNPVPSRGSSPTVKPRPVKSSEMPGFSLDAPPNLRTSLPQRPASASRDRPGAPSFRSSSVIAGNSNGKPRQPSPSSGRASYGSATANGNSHRVISRPSSNDSDDVNPVLIGTQMVERVVNSRKLAPPKQNDHHTTQNNSAGKSLSSESSGFGRNLSKKSFDMAMRHMDIRRSMTGNLRPVLTNVPASSVYSVRTRPAKSKTTSATDSPLATCSNASSEPSVSNIPVSLEGCEIEDVDLGSEGGNSSPASHQGR